MDEIIAKTPLIKLLISKDPTVKYTCPVSHLNKYTILHLITKLRQIASLNSFKLYFTN